MWPLTSRISKQLQNCIRRNKGISPCSTRPPLVLLFFYSLRLFFLVLFLPVWFALLLLLPFLRTPLLFLCSSHNQQQTFLTVTCIILPPRLAAASSAFLFLLSVLNLDSLVRTVARSVSPSVYDGVAVRRLRKTVLTDVNDGPRRMKMDGRLADMMQRIHNLVLAIRHTEALSSRVDFMVSTRNLK